MQTMSKDQWENFLSEHDESLDYLYKSITPSEFKPTTVNPPQAKSSDSKLNVYSYTEKVGKGTEKAFFFMTQRSIDGDYGFWCPKSAIIRDTGSEVELESWCKIKIIEYFW